MVFLSKLPGVTRPRQDVFSYILEKRRPYPADRVVYTDSLTDKSLTFADLVRKSRQLAQVLVSRFDLQPMDVVAILAADSIMYPIAYLSILAAGATVELIPVQRELTTKDVVARMEQAATKLILTDSKMCPLSTAAAKQVGGISLLNLDTDASLLADNVPEFHNFCIENNSVAETSAAFLNRTSGSTGGKMKTVITSHAHFIATLEGTLDTIPANTDPDADVWLSTLSFGFFINAKLNMGLNLLLGIPVIISGEAFGPDQFWLIEKYHITFLFMPPPVAAAIAGSDIDTSCNVSSIKWLLSAGASMHGALQQSVSQKLNNVHLDLEWGTTETLLIAMQTCGHACAPGSSGTLVNGMQARVIDTESGEDLEAGELGEILVRNVACNYSGYKGNQAANEAAFDSDGWFHSGDYGYLDDHCNVFIKDRLKELIRVGGGYGVHISAVELEAVIFEHPAVAQVIVTGVPDARSGSEMPTAFVVLAPVWQSQSEAAEQSLREWARQKLTGLQTLHGGFVFLDQFPLLSFKIDRRALKALAIEKDRMVPVLTAGGSVGAHEFDKLEMAQQVEA